MRLESVNFCPASTAIVSMTLLLLSACATSNSETTNRDRSANNSPEDILGCVKVLNTYSGMRVKNTCEFDLSDLWICMAKSDRQACRTNWHQVGRLTTRKSTRLGKMPRPSSTSYWLIRACIAEQLVKFDSDGFNARCE